VITELADLLKRAAPLAKLVDSDDYGPEERSRLRKLTGPRTFFELSIYLNRLSGWRARQMIDRPPPQ
jgi:hypothetical protein